jgi:hypothetical protein
MMSRARARQPKEPVCLAGTKLDGVLVAVLQDLDGNPLRQSGREPDTA